MNIDQIWVFNGSNGRFPSGIFTLRRNAEVWICKNKLTGILTSYPVDVGVYDWAIDNGFFVPKKENEYSPEFIQIFTSGSQEHYHYEEGRKE